MPLPIYVTAYGLQHLVAFLLILVVTSFLTVLERKQLAADMIRKGPATGGYLGLIQILADGMKLIYRYDLSDHMKAGTNVTWVDRLESLVTPLGMILGLYATCTLLLAEWNGAHGSINMLVILVLMSYGHGMSLTASSTSVGNWSLIGIRRLVMAYGSDVLMVLLVSLTLPLTEQLMLSGYAELSLISIPGIIRACPLLLPWLLVLVLVCSRIPYDLQEASSDQVAGYVAELYVPLSSSALLYGLSVYGIGTSQHVLGNASKATDLSCLLWLLGNLSALVVVGISMTLPRAVSVSDYGPLLLWNSLLILVVYGMSIMALLA